jgi:hypothetical protein
MEQPLQLAVAIDHRESRSDRRRSIAMATESQVW